LVLCRGPRLSPPARPARQAAGSGRFSLSRGAEDAQQIAGREVVLDRYDLGERAEEPVGLGAVAGD
jgi:hypothetical protein